jgi:G3E family GTPase
MGVIIITGELGSGKTTLLRNLLKYFKNGNVSIVVNDLASINFDECLLKKSNIQLKSVSSGCVCCTKSNELIDAIKSAKFKKIFVETTGIAELGPIIETFKINKIMIDLVITVIDATKFYKVNQFNLKNSDLIVLNKIDLLSSDYLKKAKSYLVKNSIGKVIPSVNGVFPESFKELFFSKKNKKNIIYKSTKASKHKSTAIVFVSPQEFKKNKLLRLFSKYKRVKGQVLIENKGYYVNAVDGRIDMVEKNINDTRIVFIDNFDNFGRFKIFIQMLFLQKFFFISFKQIWFFIKQLE